MSHPKEIIQTDLAPTPLGTYSQAVKVGKTVYNAGVIGIDPATSVLVEGGCQEQLTQIFKNLEALCAASGGSLKHIVQLTCYLITLDDFPIVNTVMSDFFDGDFPARATLAVSALPKGACVEVVTIMHLD
jgi:reactive intermediate/imine deaminase